MTQSKAELTSDKQILYLVQWFAEFSEFQRNDFLSDHLLPLYGPFLKEKLVLPKNAELNGDSNGESGEDEEKTTALTNGVGNIDLSSDNQVRPPSIFQCRMKLFNEWFATWSENERIELLLRLRNIDSTFLSEFYRLFLHQNSVNSPAELEQRIKPDSAELLTRLDITEKVFESKLPELLLQANFDNLTGTITNTTPDLLTDVVGVKTLDSMETDVSSLETTKTDSQTMEIQEEDGIEKVVEGEPIVQEADDIEVTKVEIDDHITEVLDEDVSKAAKSEQSQQSDLQTNEDVIIEEEADSPMQMITGPMILNPVVNTAPPDLVA